MKNIVDEEIPKDLVKAQDSDLAYKIFKAREELSLDFSYETVLLLDRVSDVDSDKQHDELTELIKRLSEQ